MHRLAPNLLLLLVLFAGIIQAADPKCSYCNKSIEGNYLSVDGKSYHEDCYRDHVQPRCAYCEKLIEGKYNLLDNKMYHPQCYTDHIVPRCDICGGPLQGTYFTDYWGNSFHEAHSAELHECSTCGRLICERLTRGGFELSDGRHLCGICNETEVSEDFLLESSFSYVRRLLESNGITNLPDDIPISLVDQQRLKQLSISYSDAMHGFTDHNIQTRNGRVVSKDSHIYILSHLPLTMFRAVLAHELMHIYLFERDLDLRSDIREGFCNLGSELVYQDTPSEYAKFRLLNMEESQDPDYGYGYRKMSGLLNQRGWRYLLETLDEID
ncbi:MAG: protein DA1 [Candidatus Marinimicrobia bacterium]|jgi:hypothetical protein|nr:protein DA1 [Candidatus Neomarinimicrobiota bacterium]MBT4361146.1 protein DA1 [Candidatus Neomarinimicrobiota bacterium]MBT4714162.1 protein DA1 [Candidatus Neomarinimicrobiota bacterium]MBT4946053.1 protein DA1 [Candidatus Neomarinimicrobiota bacterium]MBT5314134.1 protein DA1 [Candidatus Neomarinimicrobiota bacterium]